MDELMSECERREKREERREKREGRTEKGVGIKSRNSDQLKRKRKIIVPVK